MSYIRDQFILLKKQPTTRKFHDVLELMVTKIETLEQQVEQLKKDKAAAALIPNVQNGTPQGAYNGL